MRAGGRLVGNVEPAELLAVEADDAGDEAAAVRRLERDRDRPVFARLEGLDLDLAVADEAERHRLHAAGRAGAGQLAPQHRREREADEIVERAAGEIGIDQRLVDLARVLHRLEDGVVGDGVEDDALDRLVLRAPSCSCSTSSTCQEIASPSRSGSVARISRSASFTASAMSDRRLLRLAVDLPEHGEVVARDRPSRPSTAGRGHGHRRRAPGSRAQVLVDGLRLGRRLDDDDVHGCRRVTGKPAFGAAPMLNPLK